MEERATSAAAEPTASEALLNQDSIVLAERARLAATQAEWEDKLRRTEIELSLERAKIARERVEIEDKLRLFEQQAHQGIDAKAPQGLGHPPAKSGKGRWLTRLGLKDNDDE